jgi:anti-sigma factor RsiW
MRYEDVAHLLPGLVDGSLTVDETVREFIETDLRCQADLARYQRILRGLRELRAQHIDPHPGLLADTLAALEEVSERSILRALAERRRLAGAIGTAVVTAGAATAAAVIIARSRRTRTAAAA